MPPLVDHAPRIDDRRRDVALLKVSAKKDLPVVNWGNSNSARVGDWVVAVEDLSRLRDALGVPRLAELGTRPRVSFLGRVRNNPIHAASSSDSELHTLASTDLTGDSGLEKQYDALLTGAPADLQALAAAAHKCLLDKAQADFDYRMVPQKSRHAELLKPADPGGQHFQSEHRIRHEDGDYRWVLVRGVRVVDREGATVRMAGSQTDISQRKSYEDQLVHDALHDTLTGLPNRGLFLDRLERAIAYHQRHPEHHFAVIFLDLDRFKVVNDRIGHVASDGVLVSLSRRLEACLRQGDSVARLGGDEFALLLHDVENPSAVAHRIQQELARPFDAAGQQVLVTASLGIAVSSIGFSRPEDVLRDADAAMYRAKARGRARFEIADAELHARSLELLEMESQLREAVERDQLRLHYQPIVVMETRELVGFEALMRWQHPERGMRSPDDFIPLAEQTGLIMTIGRWALREACRQMEEWRRAYALSEPLWLSVNLSSRQFLHPQLVQEIHEILRETGFPPDRLRLEITESVIMDDPAAVGQILQRLRAEGIRVAVDDFGTGYSSLAYLHRLPVDTIKIDRSFVHDMHLDPALVAVIRTVISLSGSLQLETVAEGVETDEAARALREMGCHLGQGFLFSHPLPPDAAARMLADLPGAAVER